MSTPVGTLTPGQRPPSSVPLDPTVGLYTTAVAAELTGLHPQTLRFYERKGLVEPGRSPSGQRLYQQADIDRFRHIAELSAHGINLAGIRRSLELDSQLAAIGQQLQQLQHDAVATIRRVQALYRAELAPTDALHDDLPNPTDLASQAAVVPLRHPRTHDGTTER
jgi:MerR family transcriptional regulator, heat shock protein HspR